MFSVTDAKDMLVCGERRGETGDETDKPDIYQISTYPALMERLVFILNMLSGDKDLQQKFDQNCCRHVRLVPAGPCVYD